MNLETLHLIIVAVVVAGVFVALFREWCSPEMAALSAAGILLVTGILESEEMFQVFSNHAPVTIAAMFVLSAALERTGVIDAMGHLFSRLAGSNEVRVLLVLMVTVGALSAFVNNTPVVVVFMPIVLALCRSTGLKASRLLIPLSFAAMLGGTCTMLGTSTNLIVSGVVREHGLEPFGMFEITWLGVIYAAVGFAYLATIGRALLPRRETLSTLINPAEQKEFLTQASISTDSPLAGKRLVETPLKRLREIRIIDVIRNGHRLSTPLNEIVFQEDDRLLLAGDLAGVKGIKETPGVEFSARKELGLRDVETQEAVLMEGVIGPRSSFVGETLKKLNFRQKYGAIILAVHRQGENVRQDFEDVRLRFGDSLLVEGPADGIHRLMAERDFVSLIEPVRRSYRRAKAPFAIGAVVLVVLLSALKVLPIAALALLAAITVVLLKCLDSDEAYEAIEWKVIFLIFGMLAVGLAVEKTGAAELMAHGAVGMFAGMGPVFMIALVYLITVVITELISNNATAVLLTPLAIEMGAEMGIDPRPLVVAVMFAASACFATPIGYQTNTYVYGAGGYRFMDFPRVGILLNIILWIVASIMIPILWPITPMVVP